MFRSLLILFLVAFLHIIAVGQAPVADFIAIPQSGCSPLTVTFTDLSTNSPNAWNWNFGNSNNSTLPNPSASYTAPGTYTITLTVSNGSGSDSLVKVAYITVFASPTADFVADSLAGCNPLSVQFSDISVLGSAPIVTWVWDFGDGNNSGLQNPLHMYTLSGSKSVSLTVIDANGCENTLFMNDYIFISDPAQVDFSGTPTTSCNVPANVSFTDNSTAGSSAMSSWLWDFGDGSSLSTQQNPNHIYTVYGTYDVTLIVTDSIGCPDTLILVDYIEMIDFQADFSIDTLSNCPDFLLSFADSSSPDPVSWQWDFGDGNTSILQYPTYAYDSSGVYTVTLTATSVAGCVDSTSMVILFNKPVAEFSADTTKSCISPFTVNFTSTSSGVAPLTYSWDFGDGSPIGNSPNPSHTYMDTGFFNVSLIITDSFGCSDTFNLSDTIVVQLPEAGFQIDPSYGGCMPLTVNFQDSSSTYFGNIVSTQWDFGDPASGGNNTSGNPNESHTFDTVGLYLVTYTITNDWGCTSTADTIVPVGIGPLLVDFSMSDTIVCSGEMVDFTDLSVGTLNYWFWQFGDGSTSNLQNPTYGYLDTGVFTVTLIAGFNGCGDTATMTVTVLPPVPNFTRNPIIGCDTPHVVTFIDFSIGAETWLWDFGDSSFSTDTNPVHTYNLPGYYTIKLVVTNLNGCADSAYEQVVVPDVKALFGATDTLGCFSLTTTFIDSSYVLYSPKISLWQWDYGDGTLFSTSDIAQSSPTYTYSDTGIYDVQLIVEDYYGCRDTLRREKYVRVHGVYSDFNADTLSGCAPLIVNFSDSTESTSYTASWTWDFGDGSPQDTVQNPVHTFYSVGAFNIKLIVIDSAGCTDSITFINLIETTRPTPKFGYKQNVCIGEDIGITDSSSGAGITYFWDFGDGDTDTIANPLHNYPDTGTYLVTLWVTDSNGCDSNISQFVNVIPFSNAGFTVDTLATTCPPLPVTFLDSSSSDVISWFWDFGDGATSSLQNPSHTYSYPDTFDITLVVTNSTGCTDTLVVPGLIEIGGPYGTYSFYPDSGCVPLSVTFIADVFNTTDYQWDFGDGVLDSISDDSAIHIYTDPGTPHPIFIIRDSLGCTRAAEPPAIDSILIDDPVIQSYTGSPVFYTTLCGLDTVYFYDSSFVQSPYTNILSWSWDFGDSTTSTQQNPYHIYSDTGIYMVISSMTSTFGCVKFDTMFIDVRLDTINILRATISNSVNITCAGDFDGEATVSTQGGNMPYTYLWSDDSAQVTDTATGLSAGTYTVWLTDSTGCTDTATVTLIEPLPLVVVIQDSSQITCFGDADGQATSVGSGGTAPYTYSWDDVNLQTTAIAVGLLPDTFIVTIVDSVGCTSSDSVIIIEPAMLIITVQSITDVSCFSDSTGMAVPTVSGGTPAYTYSWSSTPVQLDSIADSLPAGDVTLYVTDSMGCDTNLTFTINEPLLLTGTSTLNIPIVCFGDSTGEAKAIASGGSLPYSYNWTPTSQASNVATGLWAGTFIYDITDSLGCTFQDSLVIGQPAEIDITISGTDTICTGSNSSVSALATGGTGVLTYFWSDGLGFGAGPHNVNPVSSEQYNLIVTDVNGCTAKDSVSIIVYPLLTMTVSANLTCEGESTPIMGIVDQGDSSFTYYWSYGDGIIDTVQGDTVVHTYSSQGQYTITLNVAAPSCVLGLISPYTIDVLPSPTANFTADPTSTTTANPNVSFTDMSTGSAPIIDWHWDFGDGDSSVLANPGHTYLDSGTYVVILAVTNIYGCTDTAYLTIVVHPHFGVEVPNAFTPDLSGPGGGTYNPLALDNNIFYAITKYVEEFHMTIFNRWGEMVFESFDLSVGWDGYYKSKLSQQDVYVWKIELRFINGEKYKNMGDLTLIR